MPTLFEALGIDELPAAPAGPRPPGSPTKQGFTRSFEEVPGLAAGSAAYVADIVGANETRDSLLSYAKRRQEKMQETHGADTASMSDAWDGKISWSDWLKDSAGYVAGQALQAVLTGGAGALAFRAAAKEGAKAIAERVAADAIAKGASETAATGMAAAAAKKALFSAGTRGAVVGSGAQNLNMELGSIYPDAVDAAAEHGNTLTGADKARVGLSALAAAGVDTATDASLARAAFLGGKGGSLMARARREVPLGMAKESATEGVQTVIEHYGAGRPIADDAGVRDIIDSMGVGAVGGGLGGSVASLHRATPQQQADKALLDLTQAETPSDAAAAALRATDIPVMPEQGQAPGATPADDFAQRLADIRSKIDRPTAEAIRAKFGDAATTDIFNSLNQAGNPNVPQAVREKHLQAAETALFTAFTTRVPGEQPERPPLSRIGTDLPETATSNPGAGEADRPESSPTYPLAPLRERADAMAARSAVQGDSQPVADLSLAPRPGDILNTQGAPYSIKSAAVIRSRAVGGAVVPVPGGWVVRPEGTSNAPVPDVPAVTGALARPADGGGDNRVGSEPTVRPHPPADAGTATPAAGPVAGSAEAAPVGDGSRGGDGAVAPRAGAGLMPAGLRVTFGGKTYPVESIDDAQRKWVAFRDSSGAGVSQVGNGVRVTDGAGRFVARISYNGRAWDAEDDASGGGQVIAEAPELTAQATELTDQAPEVTGQGAKGANAAAATEATPDQAPAPAGSDAQAASAVPAATGGGEAAGLSALPSSVRDDQATRDIYKIDERRAIAATPYDANIAERATDGRSLTPENAALQLSKYAAAVVDQDGKLRSGNRTGATTGQLLDAWVNENRMRRLIAKSRAENPAMWAAYDERQSRVGALGVGADVLAPYNSPEHPDGTPAVIDRKFPKNWRLKYPDGNTVLVPPSAIRPRDDAPTQPHAPTLRERAKAMGKAKAPAAADWSRLPTALRDLGFTVSTTDPRNASWRSAAEAPFRAVAVKKRGDTYIVERSGRFIGPLGENAIPGMEAGRFNTDAAMLDAVRAEMKWASGKARAPAAPAEAPPKPDRRKAAARARRAVNPETDTLLQALAKMGGIRRDAVQGRFKMAPEELRHTVIIGGLKGFPFRAKDGMRLDDAIEALQEVGYFRGVPPEDVLRAFEDAIFSELGGNPALTVEGHGRAAQKSSEEAAQARTEAQQADDFDPFEPGDTIDALDAFSTDTLEESGYADVDPETQALTQARLVEAEALGIDTEALREDAARGADDQPEAIYHARLQEAAADAIRKARQDAARRDAEAARGLSQDRREAAGSQGQESADEGLTLEAQTAEDLRAKTEREDAAVAAERARKAAEQERLRREAEAKEAKLRADRTVDDFELGQSADQQLSGIDDMFGGVSEPEASYTGNYETDLFGDPLPSAARSDRPARPASARVRRNAQSAAAVPGDTPATPGDYRVATTVGVTAQRTLGAKSIKTAADAAAATRYLYRSAVERFDGIVTDQEGKPLAVIGGFKGALSQAAVYPATLVGEAVRVPGAAFVWFSHNHPSGASALSPADEHLNMRLADAFRGSGIEPRGTLAVGRNTFGFVDDGGEVWNSASPIPKASDAVTVPAIERELSDPFGGARPQISSPGQAREQARSHYTSAGAPGLLMLDNQNQISAWIPLPSVTRGVLRGTGGLNAIYRAVSQSNAGSAIIVHGGELDQPVNWTATVAQNIGAALSRVDVRVLDIIDVKTGSSAAERNLGMTSPVLFDLTDPAKKRDQTDTPAFKAWFGDSVVTEDGKAGGKPLVVYHGTRGDVGAFAADKVKGRFPNSEGFYFASRPEHASAYADSIHNAAEDFNPSSRFAVPVAEGANVVPAYVSLQNPKVIAVSEWGTLESAVDGDGGARVRAAREAGHDGVIVKRQAGDEWDGMLVIAFRPEQIKSATGNSGAFDLANPSIIAQLADPARQRELTRIAIDRATQRDEGATPAPLKRLVMGARLRKLLKDHEAGTLDAEGIAKALEGIAETLELKTLDKKFAGKPRVRGADHIRAELLKAKRRGDISEEAARLADWFIQQNEALLDDLGISIRSKPERGEEGAAGGYDPAGRIITLFKGSDNTTTAVHEVLHHLERMMPADMQDGIRAAWLRDVAAAMREAQKAGNTAMQRYLSDVLQANGLGDKTAGRSAAAEAAAKAISDGNVPYSAYALFNPSEYWAVNMAGTVQARFEAKGSIWARTRQWLKEALEHIKGALGLRSDAPMLKALNSLLKSGDGKFVSRNMLGHEAGAFSDISRRNLLLSAAAAAASPAAQAGITVGKATPISLDELKQALPADIAKVLTGNGATNPNGAEAITKALKMLAQTGPAEIRALAAETASLMPAKGVMLTVNTKDVMNAHGAVTWDLGPHMQLFTAGGREGLTVGTFLHESMHAAILARYITLNQGIVRGNDAVMGMPAPAAAKALEQFKQVFVEFRAAAGPALRNDASLDEKTRLSLDQATGSPDEFFVRALTDSRLQAWMAKYAYEGKTLLERFAAWIKRSLFGDSGVRPSWLDAALAASADLNAAMAGDAADFSRLKAANRVNQRTGAPQREAMYERQSLGQALASGAATAKGIRLPAGYIVGDLFDRHGKVSWWDKSIGTMHHLAKRSPQFRRVYDAVQEFLGDVSYYATEAADLAPRILPKLEGFEDVFKSPLSAADTKALAGPIFEGTLTWTRDESGKPVAADDVGLAGVVWSDDELRTMFNLNAAQIGLYREFRLATDKSLTNLAISDMLRFAGKDAADVQQQALAATDARSAAAIIAEHLQGIGGERADVLRDTAKTVMQKAARADDLMRRGYAPLSRFGSYTLDVVSEDGQRVYFGLFETAAERSKMARQMRAGHPGASIAEGTVSQEEFKLFAGVSPETLELFGDMLGLEAQGTDAASQAFQTYLKVAKSNRSALKRLIERKGIAGFSEDAGRVLAGFVYSNARQTASNLHMGEMTGAVTKIGQGSGELKDIAAKLVDYVKNPQEEAQRIRALLFAQYLGGSIASAMVNATQPFTVTFPYLSQYGGAPKAAAQMVAAAKDALKRTTGDKALDAALRKAEEEGIVSPQEVHQLMAQAMGRSALKSGDGTTLGNLAAQSGNALSKLSLVWGKVFSVPEQFNRRVTFIAAYRTAVDQGMQNPAVFAEQAVNDTQFTYNKGNRPQWARGAVGSVAFTFKQYSISYVELLTRMARSGPQGRKAALLAIAVLMLMSGLDGLPFGEDIEDVVDGALQRLGYNFSSRQAKQEFLAGLIGEGGARFVLKGASGIPGAPVDVSGRLGMGNLVPGTGLFLKKTDHSRDLGEFAGPVGDFAKRAFEATGKALGGDVLGRSGALATMSPTAVRNAIQGYDMATTGMYRDQRGRKVIDVDAGDAFSKAIGFQPEGVARSQEADSQKQRMIATNKVREAEIAEQWAVGEFERDPEKVADAKADLADWNEKNPETPIKITRMQILKRVSNMRMSREQRIEKTAPKEIRAMVRREAVQ